VAHSSSLGAGAQSRSSTAPPGLWCRRETGAGGSLRGSVVSGGAKQAWRVKPRDRLAWAVMRRRRDKTWSVGLVRECLRLPASRPGSRGNREVQSERIRSVCAWQRAQGGIGCQVSREVAKGGCQHMRSCGRRVSYERSKYLFWVWFGRKASSDILDRMEVRIFAQ